MELLPLVSRVLLRRCAREEHHPSAGSRRVHTRLLLPLPLLFFLPGGREAGVHGESARMRIIVRLLEGLRP